MMLIILFKLSFISIKVNYLIFLYFFLIKFNLIFLINFCPIIIIYQINFFQLFIIYQLNFFQLFIIYQLNFFQLFIIFQLIFNKMNFSTL